MLDIAFTKLTPSGLPESGALVLPLAEEDVGASGASWHEWDRQLGGAIARAIPAAEFKGKRGATLSLYAPGGGLSRVVLLGLGKRADLDAKGAEAAGGNAAATLAAEPQAAVDARGMEPHAAGLALGAALRAYRFDRYRTKEKPEDKPKLAALKVIVDDPNAAKAAWATRRAVAEGVFLARDLVSEPPNVLHPPEFADRLKALETLGLKITVHTKKDLEDLGFGAVLGVAQGSQHPPRMVVMEWRGGAKGEKPIAMIGKGVTFDTGGISIKPASGMEDMKWDMAGAGTVAGLMAALAGRKARANVIGVVGLVENMPSGTAMRPGDVITTHSGQTVEVINTDAEGRLVLADVISWTRKVHEPSLIVDLATLTGAIIVSLGHEHAGLFANDDALADRILAAGKEVGELAWRMPMGEAYDKGLRSDIADMKNVGGRPGGSITAAQFIARFVGDTPWAHLDIAGTAWSTKDAAITPKGATAWGVRLLDRMIADHHEGRDAAAPSMAPSMASEGGEEPAAVAGGAASPATLAEGTATSAPDTGNR